MRLRLVIGTSCVVVANSMNHVAFAQSPAIERQDEQRAPEIPKVPGNRIRPASPRPRQELLDQTNKVIEAIRPSRAGTNTWTIDDRFRELRIRSIRDSGGEMQRNGVTRWVDHDSERAMFACVHAMSGASILHVSWNFNSAFGVVSWGVAGAWSDVAWSHSHPLPCLPRHVYGSTMLYGSPCTIPGLAFNGAGFTGTRLRVQDVPKQRPDPISIYSQSDEALLAMTESRYEDARKVLAALSRLYPTDATLLRRLAIAQAACGDISQAANTMVRSYAMNITLCDDAMKATEHGLTATRWRSLVQASVREGHSGGSAECWFLAATLMQAEGRDEPARKMINRAESAGLDGVLCGRMRAAL